mgnify:CR=1 FL=1
MRNGMKRIAHGWVFGLTLATAASATTFEMNDNTVVVTDGSLSGNTVNSEQVCGGFFASQSTLECMRIVNGARYLDERAVGVCKGLFSSDDTLKCLRAIRNRRYAQSDLNVCRGFYGAKDLIECLETGGAEAKKKKGFSVVHVEVPVPAPHASAPLSVDRQKVVAALKQIEAGNLKRAKRLLREFLEETEPLR